MKLLVITALYQIIFGFWSRASTSKCCSSAPPFVRWATLNIISPLAGAFLSFLLLLGWVLIIKNSSNHWFFTFQAIVNLIMRPEVKCWLNDEDIYASGSKGFAKSYSYELITEVPIMISVLINVFIFISVVSIVGSKLRVTLRKSDFRYRLMRANLALIPLLGIHYVSTMFVSVLADEKDNKTLRTVVNFVNAITLSLQGLLVSIIYCFCNAEVQVF